MSTSDRHTQAHTQAPTHTHAHTGEHTHMQTHETKVDEGHNTIGKAIAVQP